MMDERPALLVDLPTSVRGLCFHDDNGEEFVVLNSRLTWEQNMKTYDHELKHIENGELADPNYIEYREGSL